MEYIRLRGFGYPQHGGKGAQKMHALTMVTVLGLVVAGIAVWRHRRKGSHYPVHSELMVGRPGPIDPKDPNAPAKREALRDAYGLKP